MTQAPWGKVRIRHMFGNQSSQINLASGEVVMAEPDGSFFVTPATASALYNANYRVDASDEQAAPR